MNQRQAKELFDQLFMLTENEKEVLNSKYREQHPALLKLLSSYQIHQDIVRFYDELKDSPLIAEVKRSKSPVTIKTVTVTPPSSINLRIIRDPNDSFVLKLRQMLKIIPLPKIPPNVLFKRLCCNLIPNRRQEGRILLLRTLPRVPARASATGGQAPEPEDRARALHAPGLQ